MVRARSLTYVADLGFIALMIYLIGVLINAWSPLGVPINGDAYSQLQKVKWILEFWPHVTWSYQWAGGMPLMRWYPPALYYLIAGFVIITNSTVAVVSDAILFLLYFVGISCLYVLTLRLTNSRQIGLLAAVLAIISPSLWEQFVIEGVYGRVAALMMLPIALLLVTTLTGSGGNPRWTNLKYSALLLVLSLSVLFNPFFGVPVIAITFLAILFLKGEGSLRTIFSLIIAIAALDSFFLFAYVIRGPPNLSAGTLGVNVPRDFFLFSTFGSPAAAYLALPSIPFAFAVVTVLLLRYWKTTPKLNVQDTGIEFGTRRRIEDRRTENRAVRFLEVLAVLILLAMACGLVLTPFVAYIGLLVAIFPLILSPLVGVGFGRVLARAPKHLRYITPVLIIALVGSTILISGFPISAVPSASTPDLSIQDFSQLKLDQSDITYRVGISGTESWIRQWWNYRTDVPQTGDYFAQGEVSPDWVAWMNNAIWLTKNNTQETNFQLDWWAVKWILVNSQNTDPSKFQSRPDLYKSVANVSSPPIYEFEYDGANPILYATNTPTVLVIGGDQYRNVMTDFSFTGLSDSHIIPIHGGSYIDDYSLNYLQNFNAILIYGYNYHDQAAAWNLLNQYVASGGGLIIDTGNQYSPDSNSTSIPSPSPVESTQWTNLGTQWKFTWTNSDVTKNIDFSSFAPPISSGVGWSISTANNATIHNWAKPVLWDAGEPVMAIGQVGRGRVFWTGLNLIYHITTYSNPEEAKLLAQAVSWVLAPSESTQGPASYTATQNNPEQDTVVVNNGAQGVLFKEAAYVDWSATVDTANGTHETLPIYPAGPDFMYVALPSDTTFPATVTFTFDTTIDLIGFLISIIALVFLIGYAIIGTRAFAPGKAVARPLRGLEKKAEEKWTEGD